MGMATPWPPPKPPQYRWRVVPRFRRWFLEDGDRLVRVKCWRPSWGNYGLEWPCMLVDKARLGRASVTPVWDRMRLLHPFRDLESTP